MLFAQPGICLGEWDAQNSLGFWDTNGSPKLGQTTRPRDSQKKKRKKRTCQIVDFAVSVDHRLKLKESEKKDKYLDHARELKKLLNIKVTVIPNATDALGTITKGLIKGFEALEIRERVKTIQTTALLRSARILRRVLETWGDLQSLKLQRKTINSHWCKKKPQMNKTRIIIRDWGLELTAGGQTFAGVKNPKGIF